MKFKSIFITLLLNLLCNAQELKVVYNDEFINSLDIDEVELVTLKDNVTSYLKKFDTTTSINYWLVQKESVFNFPDADFVNLITKSEQENLTVYIQSIKKINKEIFQIEFSFLKNIDSKLEIQTVYKILAKSSSSEIKFMNFIDFDKKFNTYNTKTISFFSENKLDYDQANIFENENKNLSDFFETGIIRFKYFKSKSVSDYMISRGYTFERTMYLSNQVGAETFLEENLIFSGNNLESNIHELTHLYTFKCFPNRHNLIDEGLATYLGGSKGLNYKEHLKKVYLSIKNKNINLYKELFFGNYIVDDTTSLWYTVGALFCDIAIEKGGKQMLFDLLNTGNKDIDIVKKIEKMFSTDRDKIDNLIKQELKRKYDQYYIQ